MKISKIYQTLDISQPNIQNDLEITAINSLQNAGHGELAYCDSDKNAKLLSECNASAILVRECDDKMVKNNPIISV